MKKLILLAFLLNSFILNAQGLLPHSEGQIVRKTYYTLSYNEKHEQANWVYYELNPSFINGKAKRQNKFRPDMAVLTSSASLEDYKASGYDRGHLCPAAAMKLNSKAMSETFFMSNMSPQVSAFNRGIWKDLETQVRTWVLKEKHLYVVTGPVFKDNKGKIGENSVTVPGYYYKVVYDDTDEKKMIALLLPNADSNALLSSFVVSVDSIEKLTGIDFFPGLDDEIENSLEASSSANLWIWKKARASKRK